jgi:hypothetical protein
MAQCAVIPVWEGIWDKQITPKVMINLIVVGNGSPGIRRAFEPFPAFILQVLFLQQLKNFVRRVDDGRDAAVP